MAKQKMPVRFGTWSEILRCDPWLWSVQGKVASCWPRVSALTFLDLKLQTSIITNSPSCHGVSRREYIFAEECLWTIIFYPSCTAMMPITKTGINACTTGHRDGQELNMGVRRTPEDFHQHVHGFHHRGGKEAGHKYLGAGGSREPRCPSHTDSPSPSSGPFPH